MEKDKYIRFDWAVKRLLRNKANFDVLEGLLTVLLDRQIHIIDILESESNQQDYDDKFNRVDIKARDYYRGSAGYPGIIFFRTNSLWRSQGDH